MISINNVRRVLSTIFFVLCLCGLLYQLQQVSAVFFRFHTTSKIVYDVREVEFYQTIFFCARWTDVIDRRHHSRYGISPQRPIFIEDIYVELSALKIKDIFKLTPKPDEFLRGCWIRPKILTKPRDFNRSECNNIFNVFKSISGETICYSIAPKTAGTYSVGDVASYLTHGNMVYVLLVGSPMDRSVRLHFVVHFGHAKNKDPLYSRMFESQAANEKGFTSSAFLVYGQAVEIRRLPPPFDTQCLAGHDRQVCYEKCLEDRYLNINRIPWSAYIHKPSELKLFTYRDYKNKSKTLLAQNSMTECHRLCKIKSECFTEFTITSVQELSSTDVFFVSSMVPNRPHIYLLSVPFMTIVEYMVYIGSCFGTWLGLSIISLNPSKWAYFWKTPKKSTRVHTLISNAMSTGHTLRHTRWK